ncbi:hypothetical protein CCAX7_47300 [Capsulimonas corticalis]|uniref:DUF5658 domain-containing protein n=1 Tax=Capsulimonas corticalis TaxID=2219043 RepID=A0A402CQF5_9BACT|nr:DUF5658 family protein [Capsulimonas corticalis]BDI32679.1 hypothetical protein CCAX7_47300 [Capsulimonas corticalis]
MVKVSRDGMILTAIGMIDLMTTIFLVNYREASEGNPVMAYYLHQGIPVFVLAKLILCLGPLYLLEYARRHRPKMVTLSMRVAIAAYLCAYVGGISQLNDFALQARTRNVSMAWIESPCIPNPNVHVKH